MIPASPGSGRSGSTAPSRGAIGVASAATAHQAGRSHRTSHQSSGHPRKHGRHRHHKHPTPVESTSPLAAPLASALLLGDAGMEPGQATLPAGLAEAFKLRAVASGAARVLHLYLREANAASTITAGVYSESGGHPGTLLSTGTARAPRGRAWASVPITGLSLVSGRPYWLAILGGGGVLRFRDRSEGPCQSQASPQRSLSSLPRHWSVGNGHRSCPVSAYLTPAGAAPEAIVAPSVSGAASEGQTLSASHGNWSGSPTGFAYQWQQCAAGGEGCSDITGATAPHYPLGAPNVGHRLRVVVVASNENGSASADSQLTEVVASSAPPAPVVQPPSNQTPPSLTGTAVQEAVLQASPGTWSGAPTSYSYQWQDCDALGLSCLSIPGAKGASYQLAPADVGGTVRVVVEASNAGGSGSAPSAPSAVVLPLAPGVLLAPAVTGSAIEGETLSASTGSWSQSPTSFGYQWQRCTAKGEECANVGGATSPTYKLASGDVGKTLRVKVTAGNAGGATAATSSVTAVVVAAGSEPAVLVGSSTVQGSGDTSAAGIAEAFQYTAKSSGTVNTISLYVNAGGSATSIVVGIYANASGNPGTLLASATIGSPKAGAWNTVSIPAVSVTSGSVYWLAALAPSGVLAIRDLSTGGAPTKSSAAASLKELPSSWTTGATWANSPASFYAAGSAQAPPPPSPPENTVPPAISGTAIVGRTLSASHGSWSESPTTYRYQWRDCNVLGAACLDIAGASASTYILTPSDEGATVRVSVTAENSGGSATAQSLPTLLVLPAPEEGAAEREKREAEERAAKEKAEREKKRSRRTRGQRKSGTRKEGSRRTRRQRKSRTRKEGSRRTRGQRKGRTRKEGSRRTRRQRKSRTRTERSRRRTRGSGLYRDGHPRHGVGYGRGGCGWGGE